MKKRIGFCLKAKDNTFWYDVRKGIETAASEHNNVSATVRIASSTENYEEQVGIIQDYIDQGVDAIVVAPSDPEKIISVLKKVTQEKIPLFIIDSMINETLAKENEVEYFSIMFDDYDGGFQTGNLFAKIFPQSSKVAVIEGYRRGSFAERVKGFQDAIKDKLDLVEIVGAKFDETLAHQKTKQLIKKHPDLQAIFCTSDNMALGALTALSELEREDIKISGFDCTSAAILAIEQGKMLSSINTDPNKLGKLSVEQAINFLDDTSEFREQIQYDVSLVTKGNATKTPKNIVQKRTYKIVEAKQDLSEYNYSNLKFSTTCPIIIGENMFYDLPRRVSHLEADKYIIVTDSLVESLYGKKLKIV